MRRRLKDRNCSHLRTFLISIAVDCALEVSAGAPHAASARGLLVQNSLRLVLS